MDSRHLVDPELAPLLDVYQALEPAQEALPGLRVERAAVIHAMLRELPEDNVEKTEHFAPGRHGAPPVRCLMYRSRLAGPRCAAYLNIHGGGLVVGLPEQDEIVNRRLAEQLGCVVIAPAYRLAPETPFPGPLDDCCAVLDWVTENAETLGVDRTRIAVGGSSAGGGLAAALALRTRDQGTLRLAFLLLVFPMLDDRTGSSVEPSTYAGQFIWTAALNRFGWSAYLGTAAGAPSAEPYAVPARADDLAGLPPTFLACGALDLFIDENLDFCRRLIHTGVPTELHVYPGAFHAFQYVPTAEVTRAFYRDSLRALGRALNGVTAP